jgi:hypothetical protein
MIGASLALVWHYWDPAYFALAGKPFGEHSHHPAPAAMILPTFTTTQSLSALTVGAGDNQTISISAVSNQTVTAQVKAWITSPKHKQVWRSPDDHVTNFTAGQPSQFAFHYTIPAALPPGQYQVSFTISSPDDFTDYVVNESFAEFTIQ